MPGLTGRYDTGEPLAGAALNEVYRGVFVDARSGEESAVAMTLVEPRLAAAPGAVDQIREQVSRAPGLGSDHLAAVRDVVLTESRDVYVVTDPLPPLTLRDWLATDAPRLPAEIAYLGAEIASGLRTLHEQGGVHLAMLPENIRLDGTTPILTGHGIGAARVYTRQSGRDDAAMTMPAYVAPEILSRRPIGAPADMYSLGVVLYEMCCGVPPFTGGVHEIFEGHSRMNPGVPENVPAPLWTVIRALLAKDPDARPDAGAVAAELMRVAGELTDVPVMRPVHTAPSPIVVAPAPGGNAVPKRRSKALLVAAPIVVLAVVGGFLLWPDSRATDPAVGGQGSQVLPSSARPAEPSSATETVTGRAITQMPNLVGTKISDARTKLPPGAVIETELTEGPASEDGVIKAQDPAEGASIPNTVKLQVSRTVVPIQLDSLDPVDGQWTETPANGIVSLSGKAYPHSLGSDADACYAPKGFVEYNLTKAYRRLSATAGLSDDAENAKVVVLLEVIADNRPVGKYTVELGKVQSLDIDLAEVLRLRLQWQVTGTRDAIGCGEAKISLGDPRLQGFPERVPTSGVPSLTSTPATPTR